MTRPPKAEDEDEWRTNERSITVHESENEPVETGLLDRNGVMIYRVSDKRPIGFKA